MDGTGTTGIGGITAATPLRVFLSHTSDLGKPDEPGSFVAAAVAAVLRARHAVTDMAYFAARNTSPAAMCEEMVGQSDVYVAIVGLRYGSPVRDRPDLSHTELEFEAAGERGLPRLIFLVREDSSHLPKKRQPAGHRAQQGVFRRRLVDSGLTVVRVDSPGELELAVYQALVELGPAPDAPGRLATAQRLLASMPVDALPKRAPLPAGSRMPLAPNPLFVGRGDELLQVARALHGGDTTVALGQVVASTGLGGLGKTQLAVELLHRYGSFFAGGVFWLSFASADEIPHQVASCGEPGMESRPLEERVRRVKDAWQSAVPRLLVFDNCEEEALLDAWRPSSGGCRVLVTSRRSHWSPTLGVTAMPLDLLPRPDSIELLRRYRPDLAPDDPGLDALAAELGDLPLALHLAGSYLHAYGAEVSLDDYLADLRRSDVVQHASLFGAGLEEVPNPTHHVQGVAQTFTLCLARLDQSREVDRVAIALLARMACMAAGEPVPRDLLAKTLEDVDPLLRADGLRRLAAVGLVEEGEDWLRLHRLLGHFARREGLDPEAQPGVARALIGCGKDAAEGHLTGSALTAVIPHLVDVARTAGEDPSDERLAAELCTAAGQVLLCAGDLRAARPFLERSLAIHERVLGPDHSDTGHSLNNLAALLLYQGELKAARLLSERSLQVSERVLGPDHPDTASRLNNLAAVLSTQGELAAARPLYERALAIMAHAPEADRADTAKYLNNLAMLLQDQGEVVAAQSLHEHALAIREQVQGPDHPETAASLNNLALLLHNQGQRAAARPLFERALAINERTLGPDHSTTATSLNNLARLLQDQGELATARPLYERALAIRQRVLGPDHAHLYTASTLNNLASLVWEQGNLAAARPLYERALAIRQRLLGPDHPGSATTLYRLAALLRDQGDLAAARPLFERALGMREHTLGPDHSDMATDFSNLAFLLWDLGDLAAARPLFERALAIRERVLGPDHPDIAIRLNHLAGLLQDQGDLAAARPLFQRALQINERVGGSDHPDTAACLRNLAGLLKRQGDLASARPMYERALAIHERTLGPDHPHTAATFHNLATLLRDQGNPAAARPLFERALAIRERVLGPDDPDTVATRRALAELAGEGDGQPRQPDR
jgi:tetratricopeptide (TPR) repeat protein